LKAWDFAVEVYGRPGVKAAALALQDRGGQCVSLLLWRAWAAREGRAVGPDLLARAIDTSRALETSVLRPSRRLRRALQGGGMSLGDEARTTARAAYLAAELAAERALIEALETLTPVNHGPALTLLAALQETTAAWGGRAALKLLVRLADAC
jgi:uncharacterized protein (TIGR02444 family)